MAYSPSWPTAPCGLQSLMTFIPSWPFSAHGLQPLMAPQALTGSEGAVLSSAR